MSQRVDLSVELRMRLNGTSTYLERSAMHNPNRPIAELGLFPCTFAQGSFAGDSPFRFQSPQAKFDSVLLEDINQNV